MSGPDRRPFICEKCNRRFTRSSSLDRHIKSQHDYNFHGYPCPEPGCLYITKQKCNLKTHMKSKHEKAKPFKCPVLGCDLSHASEKESERHVRRQHEGKASRGGSAASAHSSISSPSSSIPPQTPQTTTFTLPVVSQRIETGTSADISNDAFRNMAVDLVGPRGSGQTTMTDNVSIAQDDFSAAIQSYNVQSTMFGDPSFEAALWGNMPPYPEFSNWF
ncbi:hypothetical protein ACEPAG_5452 [Sanghuangporus baumii]